LQVNPLFDPYRHYLLHVAGTRTEGQAIERVQSALRIADSRDCVVFILITLIFFPGKQLRDRIRQADAKNKNEELCAL
jgi:hypothetical protein